MKILIIDLETSPHISCHWRRWNENIPPEFTIEESRVICFAARWYGQKRVLFSSEWGDGRDKMLEKAYDLLDDADVVVGYNSKKFDTKRLNAEFVRLGWTPPSPYDQIDLMVQVKKNFAFSSNKLKQVLKELDLTPKLEENVNMQLWMDVVVNKDRKARKLMKNYNIQDVVSTEELYEFMLGWIHPHTNWALFVNDVDNPENPVCPNCGKHGLVKHKVRTTRVRKYQQWHCGSCGKYSRGRKNIGVVGTDNGILT